MGILHTLDDQHISHDIHTTSILMTIFPYETGSASLHWFSSSTCCGREHLGDKQHLYYYEDHKLFGDASGRLIWLAMVCASSSSSSCSNSIGLRHTDGWRVSMSSLLQ